MLEEVNWGRNPNRFNRSIAQAHENWGRTPNRSSQRLSQDRSLWRRWVSPPRKNFKNAFLKSCILVYSWSENLYFSHRIQEFSEERRLRCPTGIGAGSTKNHRLHRRFGRTHWWILSEPSHVRGRHSDDWTDDSSWHSRHHNETSKLHRSNSGKVQVATSSTESGKNRTDLVRVKGQSKEDGRSWLELVHRSWCYKAGQCRSWPWGLPRQWTVHASSYQHCRPQLFFHLRHLKSVRRILGAEVTSGLMSAFVTTRLDYCNSVLAGLPQSTIDPLQRVQNAAARLVAGTGTRDHITLVLRSLHWLPIKFRIIYKLCVLMHLVRVGRSPAYLPGRERLRSSSSFQYELPRLKLKFGERSFSFSGPKAWNSLPSNLQEHTNTDTFKKLLKTHLFNLTFGELEWLCWCTIGHCRCNWRMKWRNVM